MGDHFGSFHTGSDNIDHRTFVFRPLSSILSLSKFDADLGELKSDARPIKILSCETSNFEGKRMGKKHEEISIPDIWKNRRGPEIRKNDDSQKQRDTCKIRPHLQNNVKAHIQNHIKAI